MSKFGVMVMGPAGAGKTTFSNAIIQHLQNTRRSCFYINLDPAAETFNYQPDLDIRELITLEDVMEELGLGPNGGLIYCFEFLLQNLEFLSEALDPLSEEYLIIFDMPGQIELYTHIPLIPQLIQYLSRQGPLNINLCAAYLLSRVPSKMDQVRDMVSRREFRRFKNVDVQLLSTDEDDPAVSADPMATDALMSGSSFTQLNRAVAQLIDDFSMVSFLQLDSQDEDSVSAILSHIDDAIQYHEAQEPKEPKDEQEVDYED
ncbi:GPN-loop GTPase 3 [Penicillium taxi]|uniref:GPN-loop GTPase 3 n=1 Tax=Penicillium taxi TaxID=168475 RepID=UPI0025451763|nr:GPN-loop GTPase 3 [Penicillium taxi]KAJ5894003.1 GPN-loop GTPase 3 [Penicillium taxi]